MVKKIVVCRLKRQNSPRSDTQKHDCAAYACTAEQARRLLYTQRPSWTEIACTVFVTWYYVSTQIDDELWSACKLGSLVSTQTEGDMRSACWAYRLPTRKKEVGAMTRVNYANHKSFAYTQYGKRVKCACQFWNQLELSDTQYWKVVKSACPVGALWSCWEIETRNITNSSLLGWT
jgi:hypothetical protein